MKRETEATEKIIEENNAIAWRRIGKHLGSWHKQGIVGDEPRFLEFAEFTISNLSTYPWKSMWFRRTTDGVGSSRFSGRRDVLGGALLLTGIGGATGFDGGDVLEFLHHLER